jgi:hypothetical protein
MSARAACRAPGLYGREGRTSKLDSHFPQFFPLDGTLPEGGVCD